MPTDPIAAFKASFATLPAQDQTDFYNALQWAAPGLIDILVSDTNTQLDKAGMLGKLGEGFADSTIRNSINGLVADLKPA